MKKKYENDPVYKRLADLYLEAVRMMPILSQAQFEVKQELKKELAKEVLNHSRIRILRKMLKLNRKGPYGLRSLNIKIKAFYNYCESQGI